MSYVLLINIKFSSVFHLRWEFGAGQACCVGPVRERRSGKEHHHHRVSAGSQARGQEGEQETVTVTQLVLWSRVFKSVQSSAVSTFWWDVYAHLNLWYESCPSGWHPGHWPLWTQYPPHAECWPAWRAPVRLWMGAGLHRCREKSRSHVYRLPAGGSWWSGGVEGP